MSYMAATRLDQEDQTKEGTPPMFKRSLPKGPPIGPSRPAIVPNRFPVATIGP